MDKFRRIFGALRFISKSSKIAPHSPEGSTPTNAGGGGNGNQQNKNTLLLDMTSLSMTNGEIHKSSTTITNPKRNIKFKDKKKLNEELQKNMEMDFIEFDEKFDENKSHSGSSSDSSPANNIKLHFANNKNRNTNNEANFTQNSSNRMTENNANNNNKIASSLDTREGVETENFNLLDKGLPSSLPLPNKSSPNIKKRLINIETKFHPIRPVKKASLSFNETTTLKEDFNGSARNSFSAFRENKRDSEIISSPIKISKNNSDVELNHNIDGENKLENSFNDDNIVNEDENGVGASDNNNNNNSFDSKEDDDQNSDENEDDEIEYKMASNKITFGKRKSIRSPSEYEDNAYKMTRYQTIFDNKFRNDPKYAGIVWILFPDDPFREFWDVIVILLMTYTAILMPPILAYSDTSHYSGWQLLDNIMDGLFGADIIINFFSAYFDRDDNIVVDRNKIVKNYLFGWFILDFTSIIPFDLILNDLQGNLSSLVRVARLPRLYRVVKLGKLVRMVKIFRQNNNRFLKAVSDFFKFRNGLERLLLSVISMIVITHISACLWHVILTFNTIDYDNWLMRFSFLDSSILDLYIAEFYLIVQTITTVGYGELNPHAPYEKLFASIMMFVGAFLYSFIIGSLSSMISNSESNQARYNQKLAILLDIKKSYRISNKLYSRCKTAIKYGIKDFNDYKTFLNELPENLRTELAYIMHSDIVNNIYFFQDQPKSFIAYIGPLLKPVKVAKKEHIFFAGDPADEMFFVKSGKVAYVMEQYKDFKFLKIKQGYYFGELDLLFYGEVRRYTAKALKECELLVLNKKHFKNVFFVEFRNIGEQIFKNACNRKSRTKKIYKEALAFCIKDKNKTKWKSPIPSSFYNRQSHQELDKDNFSFSDSSFSGSISDIPKPRLEIEAKADSEHIHRNHDKMRDFEEDQVQRPENKQEGNKDGLNRDDKSFNANGHDIKRQITFSTKHLFDDDYENKKGEKEILITRSNEKMISKLLTKRFTYLQDGQIPVIPTLAEKILNVEHNQTEIFTLAEKVNNLESKIGLILDILKKFKDMKDGGANNLLVNNGGNVDPKVDDQSASTNKATSSNNKAVLKSLVKAHVLKNKITKSKKAPTEDYNEAVRNHKRQPTASDLLVGKLAKLRKNKTDFGNEKTLEKIMLNDLSIEGKHQHGEDQHFEASIKIVEDTDSDHSISA